MESEDINVLRAPETRIKCAVMVVSSHADKEQVCVMSSCYDSVVAGNF